MTNTLRKEEQQGGPIAAPLLMYMRIVHTPDIYTKQGRIIEKTIPLFKE